MSFKMRTFIFTFLSKTSTATRKFTVKKLLSDTDVDNLTGRDIINIFWDHAIENEIDVKNYNLLGYSIKIQ